MFANTPSTRPLQRVLNFLLNPIASLLRSVFSREDARRSLQTRPIRRARFEQLEARLLLSADIAVALEPPIATPDSYEVIEDTPLSVPARGVLDNDSDAEGDTLTALLVTGPQNGTLVLDPTGAFVYTPAANFFGKDSFTYQASDGQLPSAEATVTLEVAAVNDALDIPDQGLVIDEDTSILIGFGDDPDGEPLTAVIVAGPDNGRVVINNDDRTATYVPNANFEGRDSFEYEVSNASGETDRATVTIVVMHADDVPVAADDRYVVIEDTPLDVVAPGVLGNDSDADGDILTARLVTGPAHGQLLQLADDGAFTYIPDTNYFGHDSFTYRAFDGQVESVEFATVTLEVTGVNDAPEAIGEAVVLEEDTTISIDLLANDTDVDGDPLSAAIVQGPAHGTVALVDGLATYVPELNFNGPDGFSYEVTDGHGGSALAAVAISVVAVNDHAPVATDDAYGVDEDTVLSIGGPGVLGNDVDSDGDTLTALVVTGPQHGTLVLDGTGAFVYTPTANFFGDDTFTYTANDSNGASNTASVHLTVGPVSDVPVFTSAPTSTFVLDPEQTGANRDSVFQVIGGTGQAVNINSATGQAVKINFDWTFREAAYDNELGIFRVDDASGRIGTLRPGDEGYAIAALAAGRGQVIFASGEGAGAKGELTLEAGALYAFYLIQNDTTADFLASNPQNRLEHGPLAFFSLATANPDGYDHLRASVDAGGSFQLSWEDLTNGGDRDFDDVVMKAPNFRLPEPAAFTYAAHATDADGDPVTYQLLEGPDGASIDPESGLLTWRPTQPGSYRFVLRAQDAGGAFTEQSFDLEVLNPERVLFVKGTDCSDTIEISERDGLVRVMVNGEIRAYSGVTAIHVDALAGNDKVQLFGLTAQTLVYGGAGNDWIDGSCVSVGQLDLRGDAGDDELRGGAASDYLDGGSGNDKLFGRPGNDVLIGGSGNDIVKGEDGDDTIVLGSGCDSLDGGPGNDPRVSEAEYNLPVINWSAILASQVSVAPGQSSWIADFVNGLALNEAERDPNSSIRIDAPQ